MGIGTVFVTLISIWLFITLFSKLTEIFDRQKTGGAKAIPEGGARPKQTADRQAETAREKAEEEGVELRLAQMAAAAAVGVYLSRRKSSTTCKATERSAFGWTGAARREAVHNRLDVNPWRSRR